MFVASLVFRAHRQCHYSMPWWHQSWLPQESHQESHLLPDRNQIPQQEQSWQFHLRYTRQITCIDWSVQRFWGPYVSIPCRVYPWLRHKDLPSRLSNHLLERLDQIESRQKQEDEEIDSFRSKPGALHFHYSIIGTTKLSLSENRPEQMYPKFILDESEIDLEQTWDFHSCPVDLIQSQISPTFFSSSLPCS